MNRRHAFDAHLVLLFATTFASTLALAGCVGDIGEVPFSGSSGRPGAGPTAALACELPRARVWPLSPRQYDRAVHALFEDAPPATERLRSLVGVIGRRFQNGADYRDMSEAYVSALFDHTEQTAALVAADPARLAPCLAGGAGDDACLGGAFDSLLSRAWRRSPSPDEVARFVDHVRARRGAIGDAAAIADAVQAILMSPSFLYRTELGPEGTADATFELLPTEKADALAFFLIDGPPDEALMTDAASGALGEPGALGAHARRLLASPSLAAGLERFFAENTEAYLVTETAEAELDPELTSDMAHELGAFVAYVLTEDDGRLATVMSAPYSVVSPRLAELYGVPAAADGWARVDLPPGERAGLLTMAAVLVPPLDPTPIYRGKLIRERFLCDTIAGAPDGVPPLPDASTETAPLTVRDRVEQHTAAEGCQACHRYMNPLGFPFERYDASGRFRLREGEHEIDPSGELIRMGETEGLPVADAIELAHTLAVDPAALDCFVRSLFYYAYGRAPEAEDACELDRLRSRFAETRGNIVEIVVDLVDSPHFTTRRRAP